MRLNGAQYERRPGLTLRTLLDDLDLDPKKVVVMHGNDIYRRGDVPDAPVADDDIIEIVTMMQGG